MVGDMQEARIVCSAKTAKTAGGKYIMLLLPELAAALYLAFSFDVGHRRCNFQYEHNLHSKILNRR